MNDHFLRTCASIRNPDAECVCAEIETLFGSYFNVADETYEASGFVPLTLDEIDADYVADARRAAGLLDLPWPPYLPAAEDYLLDYRAREARSRG